MTTESYSAARLGRVAKAAAVPRALLALYPFVVAGLSALVLAALAVSRHDRYGSGGFDLGIFDQTIWGYSRFEILPNTVKRIPNLLGDHFHPILVVLAPGYWVWDDARVLLVEQALLIAAASLPVFYWARERLGWQEGAVVQLAFLVFFGTIGAALFDFHEVAVAAPALAFALWGLLTRRDWLTVSAASVALLAKEDVALTVAAIGLYAAVVQRRMVFGGLIAIVSAAWFVAVVKLVIPALSGRAYAYLPSSRGDRSPVAILAHPYRGITLFVDRRVKIRTLVETAGAWLALPLVSPIALIAVPTLITRFWSAGAGRWTTGFHYSLLLAPILAFASVDTLARLRARWPAAVRPAALALLAASAAVSTLIVRPLRALDGLRSGTEAARAAACLRTVSPGASVAASNALIAHLTHRAEAYPLFARQGQAFLAVDTRTRVGRRAVGRIRGDGVYTYRLSCSSGGVAVFRRT